MDVSMDNCWIHEQPRVQAESYAHQEDQDYTRVSTITLSRHQTEQGREDTNVARRRNHTFRVEKFVDCAAVAQNFSQRAPTFLAAPRNRLIASTPANAMPPVNHTLFALLRLDRVQTSTAEAEYRYHWGHKEIICFRKLLLDFEIDVKKPLKKHGG